MYFPDAEISFHAFRLEPSGQINVAAVAIKLPDGADERGTVDGWRQSKGWVPVDLQAGKLPSKSKAGVVLGFTRNGRAVVTYNGDCVYD